jgi:hypothetical protein
MLDEMRQHQLHLVRGEEPAGTGMFAVSERQEGVGGRDQRIRAQMGPWKSCCFVLFFLFRRCRTKIDICIWIHGAAGSGLEVLRLCGFGRFAGPGKAEGVKPGCFGVEAVVQVHFVCRDSEWSPLGEVDIPIDGDALRRGDLQDVCLRVSLYTSR